MRASSTGRYKLDKTIPLMWQRQQGEVSAHVTVISLNGAELQRAEEDRERHSRMLEQLGAGVTNVNGSARLLCHSKAGRWRDDSSICRSKLSLVFLFFFSSTYHPPSAPPPPSSPHINPDRRRFQRESTLRLFFQLISHSAVEIKSGQLSSFFLFFLPPFFSLRGRGGWGGRTSL